MNFPLAFHFLFARDEFRETEHPRDKDGEFTAGSGGGKSTSLTGTTKLINGRHMQDNGQPLPKHIPRIPPAWTDVHYATDPDSEILCSGYDKKGRKQVVYSDAHWAKQAKEKFGRIQELQKKFASIQQKNEQNRQSNNSHLRDLADVLKLVMTMGLRPGSDEDTGAEKKAYGATTLLGSHIEDRSDGTYLHFTGKKGVELNLRVPNEDLAASLKQRAKQAGPNGKLFPNADSRGLRKYVKELGGHFKTKDFRTLIGTSFAYDLVHEAEKPTSMSGYKKAVKAVGKRVAETLGNTATIALQSYINPSVFADWRLGSG